MVVREAGAEIIFAFRIGPSLGAKDGSRNITQRNRLGASSPLALTNDFVFDKTIVGFPNIGTATPNHQAWCDTVVQGHTHRGLVQTPKLVPTPVNGPKAVHDSKVQDPGSHVFDGMRVDNAG